MKGKREPSTNRFGEKASSPVRPTRKLVQKPPSDQKPDTKNPKKS